MTETAMNWLDPRTITERLVDRYQISRRIRMALDPQSLPLRSSAVD